MSEQMHQRLSELLSTLPVSVWGIGDIRGQHPVSREFPLALSLAVEIHPSFEEYSEDQYRQIGKEVAVKFERITAEVTSFLEKEGVAFQNGAVGGTNQETLTAAFPNKLAGVRAGLGWIGKSSLLVTYRHGPRVRLATFLLDADLPVAEPTTSSKCGSCTVCVDACLHGCIKGANWTPGIARDELIDAHRCNTERSARKSPDGKKRECGFCLLVCPRGEKTGKVTVPRKEKPVAA